MASDAPDRGWTAAKRSTAEVDALPPAEPDLDPTRVAFLPPALVVVDHDAPDALDCVAAHLAA